MGAAAQKSRRIRFLADTKAWPSQAPVLKVGPRNFIHWVNTHWLTSQAQSASDREPTKNQTNKPFPLTSLLETGKTKPGKMGKCGGSKRALRVL